MSARDAALVVDPQTEREMFAREFPHARPPVDDQGRIVQGRAPREASGVSERDVRRLQKLMAMENRMRLQGIPAATVINMNPYPLQVNSVLMGDIVVAPCPKGRPYSIKVIREHRVSWETGEEPGSDNPVPWVPIILAREFESTYYNNGGVVIYVGDGEREDPAISAEKNHDFKAKMLAAEERLLTFAREKVREANTEWNTPNRQGARNINEIHRSLANLLHDRTGQELPAWIEKIPGQYGLGTQCPRCKAIPQSGAYMCPACQKILDPRQAFEAGEIDVDNAEMRSLSRTVLEEMGLSEHVEETVGERNARLKAEAAVKKAEKRKPKEKAAPTA